MSEDFNLSSEIVDVYNRLQMEDVFHIPSSSVQVNFHARVYSENRRAIHSLKKDRLILDVYATNMDEGIKVVAALLANTRLNIAQPFGARHGLLLYILPIFHLLTTLLVVTIGAMLLGFGFGIISGFVAALTIPLLLFWVSTSLETRRAILKENLDITNRFENSLEVDETIAWLGTKVHNRGYWIKRFFFYEFFYVPIIILMFFLNSL